MKKFIILFMGLFIVTGCVNINDTDYDELIDIVLEGEDKKTNTYLEGYKLYLPLHMTLIGDLNSNNILYSGGDKYYLYVDLISYYNDTENTYNIDHSSYIYSYQINYNDKTGYIVVTNSKGGYLVEVMYNYAKIEVITSDVKKAIVDSLMVLKNINYNYEIIDSMIGTNALVYDAETFTLLGPNNSTDNFLTYEEEYGVYDEDDYDSDDVIEIESIE